MSSVEEDDSRDQLNCGEIILLKSASFSFLNQPEDPQIMLVLRGNANFASLWLFEETSRK